MTRQLSVAAVVLAAVVAPADAQVLRGVLTDAESGRQLPAAAIVVVDDRGRQVVATTSDTTGMFELQLPRPGGHQLHVSLIGYATMTTEPVLVRANETVHVSIRLSTRAVPVDPLVVTARRRGRGHLAGFERRRTTSGSGHFITRDQIERRAAATPATLVLGVPGVTLIGDRIMLSGAIDDFCYANVYVDGMLIRRSVNEALMTDWIEGVEVYPRAGTAPAEYHLNDCGSVLFWTREPKAHGSWNVGKIVAAAVLVVGTVLLVR